MYDELSMHCVECTWNRYGTSVYAARNVTKKAGTTFASSQVEYKNDITDLKKLTKSNNTGSLTASALNSP